MTTTYSSIAEFNDEDRPHSEATDQAPFDAARAEAFSDKMADTLNSAALALMTSIGHRTGLFDVMSALEPATTHEIAHAAKLSERYVREWLGAMVTGGVVEYDQHRRTYRLPPEHAACLTRKASPNNMAVSMQWIAVLGSVEDLVVEAFRHGKGVPYAAYRNFHRVMAEESNQTTIGGLFDHILPSVPGLLPRLERGIDVLDVGCGAGRAMIELASRFPNSRFTGYDFSTEAIAAANTEAARRRLANVRFDVKDAAKLDEQHRYDLITAFDAIHDQARPDIVLANIRRALRPGGVFLMQDILASSHVHCNCDHPVGTFIYTISCMHCMSVSLANNGMGLGAAWGKEKATEMLDEAGFIDLTVEQLPHDTLNYYYVSRAA